MLKAVSKDRRRGQRFPLKMNVEYRFFLRSERRVLCQGKSRTVDISRTGVLLKTQDYCPEGVAAEMLLEWPASAKNAVPMQLRVHGTVVRCDKRGTAVRVFRHGFQCSQLQPATLTPIAETPRQDAVEVVNG
jgi:hypothetical protein